MIDEKIKKYYEYLDQVFSELYKQKEEQDMKARKNDREIERYYVNCNIPALSKLKKCVHDISLEVSIQFGVEDSYKTRDVDNGIEELQEQEYFWESMLKGDSEDIFWMNAKGTKEVILSSCPKNVNQLIEQLYFSDANFTTILTSATITSGSEEDYKDRYKYFSQNTNFPIEKGYISEPKISPFNYDEHALIYYTENMPHPSKERNKFIAQGVEEIKQILEISKGKALILFTAKSDMQEVYEKLKEAVPYNVLVQNAGSSQTDILKEFKRDVNSVLLGTGAYWEGISVEGTALSNLIIFWLPFPVPEPIIDYKIKAADNGLMEVLVPEMIIKLKQGMTNPEEPRKVTEHKDINDEGQTVTIKEVPETPTPETPGTTTKTNNPPKTGDTANAILWIAILVLSATGITGIRIWDKKKQVKRLEIEEKKEKEE